MLLRVPQLLLLLLYRIYTPNIAEDILYKHRYIHYRTYIHLCTYLLAVLPVCIGACPCVC
jgi:hypothetical protein